MQIKRVVVLVVISLLAVFMLTGCPPNNPYLPGERLSAKEAWDIIKPAGEPLANDVVPVYFIGLGSFKPTREIYEGKAHNWTVGLYSLEEQTIWEAAYSSSYRAEDGTTPELGPKNAHITYTGVSLTVCDLADWKVDSPEACEIAAQNGAGEVKSITLRAARLGDLGNGRSNLYDPVWIPESTNLFWIIRAEDAHYIDAATGEYLGSDTAWTVSQILRAQRNSPKSSPSG